MTLDSTILSQNPFALMTIIGAPAILTNAASILSMNTTTRLTRCLDQIGKYENKAKLENEILQKNLEAQKNLSHKQAHHFLRALKSTYLALASFVLASFLALTGGILFYCHQISGIEACASLGFISGSVGIFCLSFSCVDLFWASQITLKILKRDILNN